MFGGFLAEAGAEVTLVGRPWHLDAIRKKGLFISGIWGEHRIKNLEICTERSKLASSAFELVLISVKSYDTEKILQQYSPAISGNTMVISLQNGLFNAEKIAGFVNKNRIISARVIFGAEVTEPGRVRVTVYAEDVMLGAYFGGIEYSVIENLAKMFTDAGIPTKPTKDINSYIWAKVLYNCCLNGLSAILGVTYGKLGENPLTRDIMKSVCKEIFEVAAVKNIRLQWNTPDEYLEVLFTKLIPSTFEHHSSMLQDVRRHRRTEIDALNGAIVKLAEEDGIEAWVNKTITALVKFKESVRHGGHGNHG